MLPVCVNLNLTSSCIQSIFIMPYFDQTKPVHETKLFTLTLRVKDG